MSEELSAVLARFHREVVLPDIERVVHRAVESHVLPLREEMLANFDAVFKRLERLSQSMYPSTPPCTDSRQE